MEETSNQTELEVTSVCAQCGQEFDKPLFTELHSGSMIEEYYACPRCLTKVGEAEHEKRTHTNDKLEEEELVAEEAESFEPVKADGAQPCPFYAGYLRKRPKGTQIPEGCLTCSKMIECI